MPSATPRPPRSDDELRYWLGNMVWHHQFTPAEIRAATGLDQAAIDKALLRFNVQPSTRPTRNANDALLVLPYPGGRHPRIGFLDGAIRPQRETKISVFTPWDPESYVVVDVPEAIWSNLGLLFLAHEHVPTVWTKQNVRLPQREWQRNDDGTLALDYPLPNEVVFKTRITPRRDGVAMAMSLTNGTKEKLTDLRVQNCVMLKGAKGFTTQTNDNKSFTGNYVAARSDDSQRWVITAWTPLHRAWANPPCPCLHSDPKFPDCEPGATVHVRGWLSFYEGNDVQAECKRLEAMKWHKEAPPAQ